MNLRSKLAAVIGAVSGVAAVPAMAEVPAGAQAVFTQAAADFTSIAGYGFTCLAAVTGGLIVFKLVKKIANKAT